MRWRDCAWAMRMSRARIDAHTRTFAESVDVVVAGVQVAHWAAVRMTCILASSRIVWGFLCWVLRIRMLFAVGNCIFLVSSVRPAWFCASGQKCPDTSTDAIRPFYHAQPREGGPTSVVVWAGSCVAPTCQRAVQESGCAECSRRHFDFEMHPLRASQVPHAGAGCRSARSLLVVGGRARVRVAPAHNQKTRVSKNTTSSFIKKSFKIKVSDNNIGAV